LRWDWGWERDWDWEQDWERDWEQDWGYLKYLILTIIFNYFTRKRKTRKC